jgi:hypothetical protein
VVNVLDPDVIVLGGDLSNMDHFYKRLPMLIPLHVFGAHPTLVLQPLHGDSSGVRGGLPGYGGATSRCRKLRFRTSRSPDREHALTDGSGEGHDDTKHPGLHASFKATEPGLNMLDEAGWRALAGLPPA